MCESVHAAPGTDFFFKILSYIQIYNMSMNNSVFHFFVKIEKNIECMVLQKTVNLPIFFI